MAVQQANPTDLIGLSTIAEICDVKLSTVNMWRTRGWLPEPVAVIEHKPLWHREEIEAWAVRTGRCAMTPGRLYDAHGYDVTEQYSRKKGA